MQKIYVMINLITNQTVLEIFKWPCFQLARYDLLQCSEQFPNGNYEFLFSLKIFPHVSNFKQMHFTQGSQPEK